MKKHQFVVKIYEKNKQQQQQQQQHYSGSFETNPDDMSLHNNEVLAYSSDGKRLFRLVPEGRCNLIGVIKEKSDTVELAQKHYRINTKPGAIVALKLRVNQDSDDAKPETEAALKQKIPRPANAFMLFANEWRKKLAVENPRESNKDISVRLGSLWKTMSKEDKEKYFALAREVDAEHKRKYPDYVYNPKEARLRKAMRDQSREQQQQQQHHHHHHHHLHSSHRPLQQPPAGISSNGSNNQPARGMVGPWLQASNAPVPPAPPMPPTVTASSSSAGSSSPATHSKPVLSPRVMAGHQRALDKTKDVMRTEYSTAASYPADYPNTVDHGAQDASDYCTLNDYSDGQKWHPYQNGMSAYHSRSALVSQMNSLHRGMPSMPTTTTTAAAAAAATTTPHATSPWGQFCNVPFPTNQSAMMRSNRHKVFLQEQQQQHYSYSAETQLSSYEAKIQDDLPLKLHSSFPQEEAKVKSPMREELPRRPDCSNESPASCWSSASERVCESSSEAASQPSAQQQTAQQQSSSNSSKQPLPGFQQAFGSTEIGKFSRSEFFANLVEMASSNLNPPNDLPKSCTALSPYSSSKDNLSDDTLFFSLEHGKKDGRRKVDLTEDTINDVPAVYTSAVICAGEKRSLPTIADYHSDCNCARLALPTDTTQDECLDLRVPARKKLKAEDSTERSDTFID